MQTSKRAATRLAAKASEPRLWVLLGSAPGDNIQLLRLAEATGLAFTTRNLVRKPESEAAKIPVQPSLHYIDVERSDPLGPPWPDAVLVIGRHRSMAALWIKEQSRGRAKVVLVGGAKSRSELFDLIISPLDHPAPERPNVCCIRLRPFGIERGKLEAAGKIWAARLAHLARPLTVLLVGGASDMFRFDGKTARAILAQTEAVRARDGGSLFISTSRRTPATAVAALTDALPDGDGHYTWRPDDPVNPYLGLLANGDRFVVTGDSLSMLVEIARLGKPLAIASMGPRKGRVPDLLGRIGLGRLWTLGDGLGRKLVWPLLGVFSEKARWRGARDIRGVHDYLCRGGWAVRLGQPFVRPAGLPPDDTPLAASRITALLEPSS